MEFDPKSNANMLYDEANLLARLGDFERALSMYDEAIRLDSSNPMYFNNRAATLKRLGRLDEALLQYEKIACDFPEYGKVFLSIGGTNIEMGNYEGAVFAYKRFYSAFKNGKFDFNPVVGGVNQLVERDDLLQTIFFTSINYLSNEQISLAVKAFYEGAC